MKAIRVSSSKYIILKVYDKAISRNPHSEILMVDKNYN